MGMCTKENKNTPGILGACMYLLCMPQRISMTVEHVWITVSIGMARALGWSVIHVQ